MPCRYATLRRPVRPPAPATRGTRGTVAARAFRCRQGNLKNCKVAGRGAVGGAGRRELPATNGAGPWPRQGLAPLCRTPLAPLPQRGCACAECAACRRRVPAPPPGDAVPLGTASHFPCIPLLRDRAGRIAQARCFFLEAARPIRPRRPTAGHIVAHLGRIASSHVQECRQAPQPRGPVLPLWVHAAGQAAPPSGRILEGSNNCRFPPSLGHGTGWKHR